MDHYDLFLQARALYRGMSGPLASVAAINAIGFGVYGNVSRRLQNPDVVQSAAIAGCASGFVQVTQLNAPKILCIDLYDLFYQIWEIEFAFFLSFSQPGSAVPWKLLEASRLNGDK